MSAKPVQLGRLCTFIFAGIMVWAFGSTSVLLVNAAPLGSSGEVQTQIDYIETFRPTLTPLGFSRFCLNYGDQCAPSQPLFRPKRIAQTDAAIAQLDEVNRSVNRAIRPQPDAPGLLNDIWTIAPKAGDCDDYAVTKRAELIKLGWSARSLLLAQVMAPNGEDHLVLVARTRRGDFVLDNLAKRVVPASRTNLKWIAMQTPSNPHIWGLARLKSFEVPADDMRLAGLGLRRLIY